MPDGEDGYVFCPRDVIHVISGLCEQEPSRAIYRRPTVRTANMWRLPERVEAGSKLLEEQAGRRWPVLTPSVVDLTDLRFGLGCDPDGQNHRRFRSSSTIDDAGFNRPASNDRHEAESASCRARRSFSFRSSPSSSATSSRTRSLWEGSRLIENQPALSDGCPKWTHVTTVRSGTLAGKLVEIGASPL